MTSFQENAYYQNRFKSCHLNCVIITMKIESVFQKSSHKIRTRLSLFLWASSSKTFKAQMIPVLDSRSLGPERKSSHSLARCVRLENLYAQVDWMVRDRKPKDAL